MKRVLMFENGSGRKVGKRVRRKTKHVHGGRSMAKKRRRRATHARKHNPVRRRRHAVASFRRRARRNPAGISARGLIGQAMQGVKDGVSGVVGLAGVRTVRDKLGFAAGSAVGSGVELVAALGLGMVAQRFLGGSVARAVVQGGFMSPIMSVVKAANVPFISSQLGGYGGEGDLGLYFPGYGYNPGALSAYPSNAGALAGYPTAPSLGDEEEAYSDMAGW